MKSFTVIVFVAIIAMAWASGCEHGSSKTHEDGCNRCLCTNGNWACTQMQCVPKQKREVHECQEGETKEEQCNMCRCIKNRFACTKRACPPGQ